MEGTHAEMRLQDEGRRRAEWTVTSLLASSLLMQDDTETPERALSGRGHLVLFLLYIFPFNCVKIYPETNDPKKKLAETETVSQQLPGLMRCSEMLLTP